jgi:hypothetical protein
MDRSGAEACLLPTRIVLPYLMLGHNDQDHTLGCLGMPACMAPAGHGQRAGAAAYIGLPGDLLGSLPGSRLAAGFLWLQPAGG